MVSFHDLSESTKMIRARFIRESQKIARKQIMPIRAMRRPEGFWLLVLLLGGILSTIDDATARLEILCSNFRARVDTKT